MIASMNDADTRQNEMLDRLERWVRAGNYREAKRAVKEAAADPSLTEAGRKRLDALAQSMATDKGAVVALGMTGIVLLFLIFRYWI